jgi:long-chain acyl-CoA synthetase
VIDDLTPALIVWQEQEVGDAVTAARALAIAPVAAGSATTRKTDDPDGYEAFLASGAVDDLRPARSTTTSASSSSTPPRSAARPNGAVLSHRACIAQGVVHGAVTGTTATTCT